MEIVHAIPRDQAAYLIGEVTPRMLWSHFRFLLPGEQKPSRINVNRQWRQEMEYLAQVLHPGMPAGHHQMPQQQMPGHQPYPGGQFPPPAAAPQQQFPPHQAPVPPPGPYRP